MNQILLIVRRYRSVVVGHPRPGSMASLNMATCTKMKNHYSKASKQSKLTNCIILRLFLFVWDPGLKLSIFGQDHFQPIWSVFDVAFDTLLEILNFISKIPGQIYPVVNFVVFFYLTHWYFLQFDRTLVRSEFPGEPGLTGKFNRRDPRTTWSEDWSVRLGPRYSKLCWSWSGSVLDFSFFRSWSVPVLWPDRTARFRSLDPCLTGQIYRYFFNGRFFDF